MSSEGLTQPVGTRGRDHRACRSAAIGPDLDCRST